MRVFLSLLTLSVCAVLFPPPCHAQLAVSAALTRSVTTTYPSRDREAFGLRYRTPALHHVSLDAGTLFTAENGLLEPNAGAGIRHWAVGLGDQVTAWWRPSVIYGNFDELRAEPTTLPQLTYYRFWAVGNQFTLGQTSITVEKLLSAPHQTHAALHDWELQAHGAWWDVMASRLTNSVDQAPYHFLTAEATLRPFTHLPVPFRYIGVEGGTRALPSTAQDREALVTFASVGFFFHAVL